MRASKAKQPSHKQKKSYTLSRSSVIFLERLHKETAAPSMSFLLDRIIREAEEQRKREALEQAFKEYYDNLSVDEERELREWGEYSTEVLRRRRG
jgi:hypothetical protein